MFVTPVFLSCTRSHPLSLPPFCTLRDSVTECDPIETEITYQTAAEINSKSNITAPTDSEDDDKGNCQEQQSVLMTVPSQYTTLTSSIQVRTLD